MTNSNEGVSIESTQYQRLWHRMECNFLERQLRVCSQRKNSEECDPSSLKTWGMLSIDPG